ncbi:MAG: T9SS type B sorting domain-containing protein [Chitinophagales bacterium]|nr:T9SS type B sorting domain-containing protein [Chitinophagales bacterium]
MNLKFCAVIIVASVLSIFSIQKAEASHLMGADLSYLCLDPDSNTYLITLNLYRDCAGITAPFSATITFNSVSCNQNFTATLPQEPCNNVTPGGTPCEVSQLCDSLIALSSCNGGTLPGVELYTYQAIVTLPDTCDDWVMSYSSCCRNDLVSNLANPAGDGMYVEATLDNTDTCNSSPTFTNLPVTYICAGQPFNYNHGALDIDGDSLVYTLINPLDGPTTPLVYAPGFTPTNPVSTTNGLFTLDTLTGQLTFTPDSQQIAVVTFLVQEYADLDGDGTHETLIGSTMRDMQIIILDLPGCSNPGPDVSQIDSTTLVGGVLVNPSRVEVCPGDSLYFELSGRGIGSNTADSCVFLTSNVNLVIPAATFDTSRIACDSVRGYFSWLPTAFDIGIHNINVFVNVNSCPFRNVQTFNITVEVLEGTFAGPDLVYCPAGGPRQINVAGGSEFHWTPSGAGSGIVWANADSSKIRVAPGVTTDYIVLSDLSSTCKNRDTVNVKVVPDFIESVSATKDTICLYDSTFLNVTIAPPDLIWAPFTYNWTPDKSLSKDSIPDPGAAPFKSTNYMVSVTSDTGCTIRDSIKIVVSGVAPPFIIFDGYPIICAGDSNVIEVQTCNTIFEENFDPMTMANWSSVTGTPNANTCGSVLGNALLFNNNLGREAATIDLNTIGGGKVEFWLKYGTQFPCDPPEPGDEVTLQYSTNGGGSWNTIQTFLNTTGVLDTFKFFSINIPLNAQSPNTRFRWNQALFAGTSDNWAIDEIVILRGCCDTTCNYDYQWSPTTGISDPTAQNPSFYPSVSTTYTVTVTVPGTDCFLVDSLNVAVVPNYTYTTSVSKDTICLNDSVQLLFNPDPSGAPYTYDWTPSNVLTNSAIMNPVGFPFQTTSYTATVISTFGCRKIDSIPVVVSGVSPSFLLFDGNTTVCLGDSNIISVETCRNFFSDDFDPDVDLPIWAVNDGVASADCGFVSAPNALYFNTAFPGSREARTPALNVTSGGLIEFYLKISNTFAAGCETADLGEEVTLEYSINNGFTWVIMSTFDVTMYPNFTFLSFPIPIAAQTPSTQFRWRQALFSCQGCDNWALDDVNIQLGCCDAGCGPYAFQWSPTTGISDSTSASPYFFPTTTTTYTVTVTVPGTDCQQIDSVTIDVVPNFTWNLTVTDDTICLFDSVAFLADPDISQAPYSFQWNEGGSLTNDTIPNPGAVPPGTFNYVVEMTSDAGCIHYDSVLVVVGGIAPQFIIFDGNTTVCLGDSNRIEVTGCEGTLFDDFDPDLDASIWDPITTGTATDDCGSFSGVNALYFNNGTNRSATTFPLDVTVGGDIEFYLKFGTGTNPCETADFGEDVVLEYSTTGTAGPWVLINTYAAGGGAYATFTLINEQIPGPALTANTIFRWRQVAFSGATFDHWSIDDVKIDVPCGPFDYQWSPTTGIDDPTSGSPLFFPTTTTTYYVTVSAQNPECRKIDSVTISVVPNFNYSVEVEDDTICENQSTYIHITADSGQGPYTYSWTPVQPIEGSDSSKSAHVRPKVSTYFNYEITSAFGCRQIDSSLVHVDGKGPYVKLSIDNNFICPGDTVTITADVSVLSCGLNPNPSNPCPPNSSFVVGTLGTGTQTTTAETPFKGFWTDSRVQMMYRASELKANGLNAGTITDIAFEVQSIASTQPYQGFTIRIGCTKKKSLGDFINGLDQVYTNASYTPVVGFNTFTFTNPYDWDGQSNLIVEVCFDNGTANWTLSDPVFASFTNFNSVLWDQSDFEIGCALPTPIISNLRANALFVMCTYSAGGVTLQWDPSGGLFDVNTGTPCDTCNPVKAVVFEDTEFTLTAFDGTCEGDSTISIRIDSSFYISAQTDTAICYSDSVPLEVLVFGKPPSVIFACGVNATPCVGNTNFTTGQVGNATTTTGANSFEFSVYNGFFTDAKTQILYRASELTAAGMVAGTITDISYYVNALNTFLPYDDFTIRIGCTTDDVLSGFNSAPLSTVFGPISYTPNVGWNLHNLAPAFDWDGQSNIIVEICFHNLFQQFIDDDIEYTNTTYNSVAWAGVDFDFGCSLPSAIQTHGRRPNTLFVQCVGDDAPISYLWSPDSTLSSATMDSIFANPNKPTNYTVRASFANGCVLYDSVYVDIGGFTYTEMNPVPDTICPGDTAQLEIVGGDFIRWIKSDSTITDTSIHTPGAFPLGTRWYVYIVSDSAGCQVRDSVLVVVFAPPPIDIGNDTVICSGASVVLDGGPGWQTYEWVPGGQTTQTITVNQSGSYYVILQDKNCSYPSPPVNIGIPQPPTLGPDQTFCAGDSATIIAPPGYTSYSWAITGDTTQSTVVTSTGTYNVSVTDIFNCNLVSSNLQVTEVPLPDPSLGPDVSYCAGDGVEIGPPNTTGATYSWSPTNDSTRLITVNTPGTYSVTVSVGSCANSDSIDVVENANPNVSLGTDVDTCCGSVVTLNANVTPPVTYFWSTGDTTSSVNVNSTGLYAVFVTDPNNCTDVDTINVEIQCIIDTVTAVENVINEGETSLLTVTTLYNSNFQYEWIPGMFVADSSQASATSEPLISTVTFTVEVTDLNNGCLEFDTVQVQVIPTGLGVTPNAFTPNADGLNDLFIPLVSGATSINEFRIYNRWGDKLYDYSEDVDKAGWDGMLNGTEQPVGSYVYYISLNKPDPDTPGQFIEEVRQGTVSLIR